MSHTNQAAQPQKRARGLKFRIKKEERLYYLCSKNKDTEELGGYCTADQGLCFHTSVKSRFPHDEA